MAIDRKLLEILVCPITKQPLFVLKPARLDMLNQLIEQRKLHAVDGSVIEQPLQQALITQNGTTIYRVDGDVPVMLEEQSIPCEQLTDW